MKDLGIKKIEAEFSIYDVPFNVELNSDKINSYTSLIDEIKEKTDSLNEQVQSGNLSDEQATVDMLKFGFDGLLGDGSYDQIKSKQSDTLYLSLTLQAVANEISEQLQAARVDQVVDNITG